MLRNKDRQYIPTMPANPAPSLWQRLRGAASVAVATIRSAGARVVAFVARKVTGARAALSRVARAAMVHRPWVMTRDGAKYAATRTSDWCRATWYRVVHPFMRVRVTVLGIGAVVVGLVIAPVATLVTLAVCGVMLVGLSRLIGRLEGSGHPAARVTLRIIEAVAQALRVAAYVAAGVAVLAISAVSAAFAITEVLELVLRYLDVPLAAPFAALAFFVLTASWGLAIMEVAWLAMVHEAKIPAWSADKQVIPLIRIDPDRAWDGENIVGVVPGTEEPLATEEEMQDTMNMIDEDHIPLIRIDPEAVADNAAVNAVYKKTSKCMGCDLDDASPRYGLGSMTSLCGGCFKCLVDDELIGAADRGEVSARDVAEAVRAGIPVPAYVVIATGARLRSTRIDLDGEAITCRTPTRVLSEQDPSRIHWVETGWWFDGRGERRARRWHGFVAGLVAAQVDYAHDRGIRGFYVASPRREGTPPIGMGPYRTLSYAQEVAADELSDYFQEHSHGKSASKIEVVLDGSLRSVS